MSADGIAADLKKVKAVQDFPVPTDVKIVRCFVGLTSYYRRFVPNYAKVARPLHQLTKKNVKSTWTQECQEAIDRLKELLTTSPVLAFPNFEKPFTIETDASGVGLGAILAQEGEDGEVRPVAYAS